MFVNQWAANGEKTDEVRYDEFLVLLGQGEQRCSEPFVDIEGSRTGENCSSQGGQEQRHTQ